MWKQLLVLGCTLAVTACATSTELADRKFGREVRERSAVCYPQVGSRLLRHARCVNRPVRSYAADGTDAIGAWWLDPAVSFH